MVPAPRRKSVSAHEPDARLGAYSLEAIVTAENLQRTWQRVKASRGAAGIDAMTVAKLPPWVQQHWPPVKTEIIQGTYSPQAVRRVWVPKANGDLHPLGIPAIVDRAI